MTTGTKDLAGVTTSAITKKKPQGRFQLCRRKKTLVWQLGLCLPFFAFVLFLILGRIHDTVIRHTNLTSGRR